MCPAMGDLEDHHDEKKLKKEVKIAGDDDEGKDGEKEEKKKEEEEAAADWQELKSPEGHSYYFHTHSRRVTWTRPPALGGRIALQRLATHTHEWVFHNISMPKKLAINTSVVYRLKKGEGEGFLAVPATVRYFGKIAGKGDDRIYAGLELDTPSGDCDGGLGDVSYFKCEEKKGVFAALEDVRCLNGEDEDDDDDNNNANPNPSSHLDPKSIPSSPNPNPNPNPNSNLHPNQPSSPKSTSSTNSAYSPTLSPPGKGSRIGQFSLDGEPRVSEGGVESEVFDIRPTRTRTFFEELRKDRNNTHLEEGEYAPSSPQQQDRPGDFKSKMTCTVQGCMQFAVRGDVCLRHVWRLKHKLPQDMDLDTFTMLDTKQYKIANEITTTEISYADALEKCVEDFLIPLQEATVPGTGAPLMSPQDVEFIFDKVAEIHKLSKSLAADLRETRSVSPVCFLEQVGTTLLHYSGSFRLYQGYLEHYDDAAERLDAVKKGSESLATYLSVREAASASALSALLITPVQRLPRYLLLFDELLKNTPDGAVGKDDMLEAQSRIKRIAQAINASLHQKDKAEKVKELEAMFERDDRFVPLSNPGRRLVKIGWLLKHYSKESKQLIKGKTFETFLFNDILMWADRTGILTRKYKMKTVIPLQGMEVEPVNDVKGKRYGFLIHPDPTFQNLSKKDHFLFSTDKESIRDAWMEALKDTIQEYASSHQNVENFDGRDKSSPNPKMQMKLNKLLHSNAGGQGSQSNLDSRSGRSRDSNNKESSFRDRPSALREKSREKSERRTGRLGLGKQHTSASSMALGEDEGEGKDKEKEGGIVNLAFL